MTTNVGIIGFGIIGQAVYKLFNEKIPLYIYDPVSHPFTAVRGVCVSSEESAKPYLDKCDITFVCVPTPHDEYNGLDMSIIEESIQKFDSKIFVISSALQPGTADRLSKKYNKRIVVQPEYYGETIAHPLVEMAQQRFLILGGKSKDVDEVINLYKDVYNANTKIRKVTALEAEVIKLSENRAISYKVLQCQELYDVCVSAGVDYNVIREAVYGDDPRFNLWWTFIYENCRGLTSKCLPKDLYGWHKWATDNNIDPKLSHSLLEYNKNLVEKNKE